MKIGSCAQCEQCQPLYNDKPYVSASATAAASSDAIACRACSCNGHATSCVYNKSLDAFPNDRSLGSGGQCACADHTAGQHCDTCADGWFALLGNRSANLVSVNGSLVALTLPLNSPSVCSNACACDLRGAVDPSLPCNKVRFYHI